MAAKSRPGFFRVKEPFVVYEGGRRVMRAGAIIASTDPAYKGHEALFEPLADHVQRTADGPKTRGQ